MAASEEPAGRARPQRKRLTPEQLLLVLNERLRGYGHCESCHFAGPIRRLVEPESDGRNWSRYIALVCTTSVASGCVRVAERIIGDAVGEYNLE